MSKEIYRIDIEIEAKDEYSKGIDQAKKGVEGLEKSADKATKGLSDLEKNASNTEKESEKLGKSVGKTAKDVDKLGKDSKNASKGVGQVGDSSGKSEKQVSRFQKTIQKSQRTLERLAGRRWQVTLRTVDRATRTIRTVGRTASRLTEKTYRTTLSAVNLAGGVIRGFSRALLSLPTMITVGLGVVGVGKLSSATLGSAMNFEDYGVSMDHWLNDDKKTSKALMKWMGQKADVTPFTSADIFPAMTGAISLAGNDPKQIKRLTSTAIDMASLVKGATVEDAMQAIQNAKMGEMTMMKRFGFNISKKEMDKMGWSGFVNEVEKRFKGGALRLSKTARGQINTLKGYMSSQFRSMGDGVLEGMKPRLEGVIKWLMDNEKAWGKWKSTVENAGRQASEWIFSKLETGFNHIRTNYLENDEFKKLDFEGKLSFIMDDLSGWWSSHGQPAVQNWWDSTGQGWAENLGMSLGEAIVKGMTTAVKTGIETTFNMWGDIFDTAQEHGVFSKETGSSAMGALGGTALIAGAGSLLLHPLFKMLGGLYKGGGALLKGGKDIYTTITGKGGNLKGGKHNRTTGSNRPQRDPKYTHPWFNRGKGTSPNMPNQHKTRWLDKIKLPKGLNNLTKRLPLIGPALSALSLIGSTKEELPGAIGGIGGGLAGAAIGASIGSVVPVVGTAIGGIGGGILGSIGGGMFGDWLGDKFQIGKGESSVSAAEINQPQVGNLAYLTTPHFIF